MRPGGRFRDSRGTRRPLAGVSGQRLTPDAYRLVFVSPHAKVEQRPLNSQQSR